MGRNLFLFGLLAGFVFSGCQGKDENASVSQNIDQQSTQQEGGDQVQSSAVVQAIGRDSNKVLDDDAAKDLPDSADELMSLLSRFEIEQLRETDANKLFAMQRRRAIASAKLLSLDPILEQKQAAIRIHCDALLRLASMKDLNAADRFRSFSRNWQNDTDSQIRRTLDTSSLAFQYWNAVRRSEPDFDELVQSSKQLASRYPADPIVFKQLNRIGQSCLQQGHEETYQQIAQSLIEVYGTSAQPGLREATTNLQRQLNVHKTSLTSIARRIAEHDIGAMQEFRIAIELLAEKELTAASLQQIGRTLLWLERNATVQQTLKANQIAALAADRTNQLHIKKLLSRNCELRQARLKWVGEEFSIQANSARGGKLNWNQVSSNRRTMVVFWSPNEVGSVRFVQQLAEIYKENQEQPIQLVAINVTQDESANREFGQSLPQWELATVIPERRSFTNNVSTANLKRPSEDALRTYGIESLPQLMTVDANGIVTSVNPDSKKLNRFLNGE